MLKLNDVYALPAKLVPHSTWVLRSQWLPELQDLDQSLSHELLEMLDREKRFEVRQLVYENFDGERFAQMHALWFDGKPVCTVQDAGRGGCDHHRRWVTDAVAFELLLTYLRSRLPNQWVVDVADPNADIYPEEVFSFYGTDFSEQFGITVEPTAPGFMLAQGTAITRGRLLPDVLVSTTAEVAEAPAYVRKGGAVFKLVRPVSEEEHALNSRLVEALQAEGFIAHHWYERAARPDGQPVVSI